MRTNITVVNKNNYHLHERLIEQFVELHFNGLYSRDVFNKKYLKLRFKYLFISEDSCAIFIFTDLIAIGLVYGGPDGYNNKSNSSILKNNFLQLLSFKLLNFVSLKKILTLFLKYSFNKSKDLNNGYKNNAYRLTGIVTTSNLRSHGIGTILLNNFIDYAKKMNYNHIVVKTPKTNLKAIKFYQSNNFIISRNFDLEIELSLTL